MNIEWAFRNFLRKIAGKRSLEEERLNKLMRIRLELDKNVNTDDPLYRLMNDFTLDSITVSKSDGTVIIGNGGSHIESMKGSSLFDYIKNEIPEANYIMIKTENGVRVIYSDGEYIYIVRAKGYVSPLEMKLVARRAKRDVNG